MPTCYNCRASRQQHTFQHTYLEAAGQLYVTSVFVTKETLRKELPNPTVVTMEMDYMTIVCDQYQKYLALGRSVVI